MELIYLLIGLALGLCLGASAALTVRRRPPEQLQEDKPRSRETEDLERQYGNLLRYDGTGRGQRDKEEAER